MECIHNNRACYKNGFYCEDCNTFFSKDSPTYRRDELLSSIWMVLHNINAKKVREGSHAIDALMMRDKIGIGIDHENYQDLIEEAEKIMEKYGETSESCKIVLK